MLESTSIYITFILIERAHGVQTCEYQDIWLSRGDAVAAARSNAEFALHEEEDNASDWKYTSMMIEATAGDAEIFKNYNTIQRFSFSDWERLESSE